MKNIFLFCFIFKFSFIFAQCQPFKIILPGNFNTPLTESLTWIKTTPSSTIPTTVSATAIIKLDADRFNGYIELNPGFISFPTTTGAFIAEALDGCGNLVPNIKDVTIPNVKDVTIYPNPGSDIFYIKTDNIYNGIIEVYNSLGIKILEPKSIIKDTISEINLQNQPLGLYIVRIVSNDVVITKSIIKI